MSKRSLCWSLESPGNCDSRQAHRHTTKERAGNPCSLTEALAKKSSALCQTEEAFEVIEDFSGGLWRRAVYSDEANWPAVCTPFERLKYRCATQSGISVLWKFVGLGALAGESGTSAEGALAQMSDRAAQGWAPRALGFFQGFLAQEWVEGSRLTQADARDLAVLSHIGIYLTQTAGPALSVREQEASISRLDEMLYWNTKEALGEKCAAQAKRWSQKERSRACPCTLPRAGSESRAMSLSFPDGHLAPHEWVRTSDGRILKTDSTRHDVDHTIVGKQSILWDVAGVFIEWKLDLRSARPLLEAFARAGIGIDLDVLTYYCLAYAAFRLGQTTLCAGLSEHDPAEQERLKRSAAAYRQQCIAWLES